MDMGSMTATIGERLSAAAQAQSGAVPCARSECKGQATTVDTRRDRFPLYPGAILRTKKCGKCGFKWATLEAPLDAFSGVVDDAKDQIAKAAAEATERATVAVVSTVRDHLSKLSIALEALLKVNGGVSAPAPASQRYSLPSGPPSAPAKPRGRPPHKRPSVRPGERVRAHRPDKRPLRSGAPSGDAEANILKLPAAIQNEARELRQTLDSLEPRRNGARDVPKNVKADVLTYVDMADNLNVQRLDSCGAIGLNTSCLYRWKRGE